jgi:hypothetical protein
MAAGAPHPVDIVALGLCAADVALWRMEGKLHVTVLVKATFDFTADGAMTLVEPEELVRAEVHHNKNPMRSVRLTTDFAPFLPRADVTLTGHACAPLGTIVEAVAVRLVVYREGPLVDKTVHARGDAKGDQTAPFDRIPLMYERAFGGIGWEENPLGSGSGATGSTKAPNLTDPADPRKVACFGPISRGWPARKRLLGTADRRALDRPVAEVPAGFDWSYFQAAPPDQRTEYLQGNEWIILDGMNPSNGHYQSHLPWVRGMARVHGLTDGGVGHLLPLVADTLRIDADALQCSVVWRGSFPLPDEAALPKLKIYGAIESGGHPIEWPVPPPPAPAEAPADAPIERPTASLPIASLLQPADIGGTMMLEGDEPPPVAPGPAMRGPAAPAVPIGFVPAATDPFPRPGDEPSDDFIRTGDIVEEPDAPKWASTMAIGPEAAERAAATPATPFRPGESRLPPPMPPPPKPPAASDTAERAPFGSSTLFIEDQEDGARPAPPSLPFRRPPAPPPGVRPFSETPPPPPAAAVDEPAPPRAAVRRKAESAGGIEIVNDTGLTIGVVPWELKPSRDCLTVFAKATCDLAPGGPAKLRARAEPAEGDRFTDDGGGASLAYPTDLALFKVRADVVAVGHAYAPRGPIRVMEARFAFGSDGNAFDRKLAVFGDRRWERGPVAEKPSEPDPFVRMPLRWERAFGGTKFDANPAGIGYPDRMRRGPRLLPNLEDPARRLRTPNQIVAPACFGPIPLAWKDRAASRGRARETWPLLPEELDWTRFQAAPAPQQLAFLQGDEPFALHGMHARHAVLAGSLPGVRARCFAVAGGRVDEIALRLDTVVFTVDEMRIDLVFRGALPVADERAPGGLALHLYTEKVGDEGMTLAEARDKLLRR